MRQVAFHTNRMAVFFHPIGDCVQNWLNGAMFISVIAHNILYHFAETNAFCCAHYLPLFDDAALAAYSSWALPIVVIKHSRKGSRVLEFPKPPMCRLKRQAATGAHIPPARAIALTRKCQRVIFAFIIDTKFQLDMCRSRGNGLPYLFHLKTVI